MNELIATLNSIQTLAPETADYLQEHLKYIEIPKKKYLLKQGRVCFNIYFVVEGCLRCFYEKSGKEVNSWFMMENDVITSVESFFGQQASYENIQALEPCSLFYVDFTELQFLYDNHPEFNYIGRVLIEKYYRLSEQRLYSLRMQKGMEKYSFLLEHYPNIIQRVPLKYIASYLSITEETLSRIRAAMASN